MVQRGPESLGAERLQQVIERVNLEGPQGVLVVSRHEDHGRHPVRPERIRQLEPGHARHLDVEEEQIRRGVAEGRDGLRAIRVFAHHLDVLLLAEERQDARPRHRLIVDDDRADF